MLVIGAGNPIDHQTRYTPMITLHRDAADAPTELRAPMLDVP